MLKGLSEWLYRVSRGWVALLGVLVFAAFIGLVLPGQAAEAETYSAAAGSPDGSFYYSAAMLYEMAESYGEEGRQQYIRSRFTFDIVWPIAYMFFLATVISWVFGRVFTPGNLWRLANVVPILGGFFDYVENISAAIVMGRYPATTPILDVMTSVFTMIKWIFVNGSFVILALGLIAGLIFWIRTQTEG